MFDFLVQTPEQAELRLQRLPVTSWWACVSELLSLQIVRDPGGRDFRASRGLVFAQLVMGDGFHRGEEISLEADSLDYFAVLN